MKNKPILLLFLSMVFRVSSFGQTTSNLQQPTSINSDGAAPAASAMLDVSATNKGMLVPRMTTAQRTAISSPATGLLVFDTTTGGFWFYNGTAWTNLSGNGNSSTFISDADGNTKVQTEKNPNEDIIRFEVGGTEGMSLRKNTSGLHRLDLPNQWGNTFIGENAGLANTTGFNNTATGLNALSSNTTGYWNTATGWHALFLNTEGRNNTATGAWTLYFNTTGFENIATGNGALFSNTEGYRNTATGMDALHSNTTGMGNTATGTDALHYNTTGFENTAVGIGSLFSNTEGYRNTASGRNALFFNTYGHSNVASGAEALYNNTVKSNLVAVGDSSLYNNGIGATAWYEAFANTAIGSKALFSNTKGYFNTANGWRALFSNTVGAYNTAVGMEALRNNTTGFNNTAIGTASLFSNMTGFQNTANGANTLYSNTEGSANTANGFYALRLNTTGFFNTATGAAAMENNSTGAYNTANGANTLTSNTTGAANTATGYGTLQTNTTGTDNTANGANALHFNTTGAFNNAVGKDALYSNTTGSSNTANGVQTLFSNTTGGSNTATGWGAGSYNDNNTYCIFIGYDADQTVTTDFTNSTALGNASRITASNQVRIGNSSVASIGGYANWTNISDSRFKQNIHEDIPGLGFILKLRPVTYNLNATGLAAQLQEDRIEDFEKKDGDTPQKPNDLTRQGRNAKSQIRYSGFIAQEVEQAALEIGYDFSGVDKPENRDGLYGLRYAEFVVPLVKAMQEQQNEILSLKLEVEKLRILESENAALKSQLNKITSALLSAGINLEVDIK